MQQAILHDAQRPKQGQSPLKAAHLEALLLVSFTADADKTETNNPSCISASARFNRPATARQEQNIGQSTANPSSPYSAALIIINTI
jgi:hypothetical protein